MDTWVLSPSQEFHPRHGMTAWHGLPWEMKSVPRLYYARGCILSPCLAVVQSWSGMQNRVERQEDCTMESGFLSWSAAESHIWSPQQERRQFGCGTSTLVTRNFACPRPIKEGYSRFLSAIRTTSFALGTMIPPYIATTLQS